MLVQLMSLPGICEREREREKARDRERERERFVYDHVSNFVA